MKERLSKLRLEDLTTSNHAMARCLQLAALAAKSTVPVVLLGETGTGKTLLAQAIHNSSGRANLPFISFNASAISDTLLESQLFGHERGAFTGAQQTVKGKFELADRGTLFLDEISEMSPLAQVKILRVLEYGEFERLGSERMLTSNARIICASNCSLRERVRLGKLREDLYQRLNGLTLLIPPLRERLEELPALIATELQGAAAKEGKHITAIHPEAMDKLLRYEWPGNLRELSHTVRTMILFCSGSVILPEHVVFPSDLKPEQARSRNDKAGPLLASNDHNADSRIDPSLEGAMQRHVRFVYDEANQNQRRAARLLGISRSTLSRYLRDISKSKHDWSKSEAKRPDNELSNSLHEE
jgi:transcriptional regulator with PAS, ATPase and Fis domain